ncbi:MAG: hypothetical protein J7M26_10305 [Armatimonadetes bacterium]|nr:hypothetical protein [Armatimonadota bacterium]
MGELIGLWVAAFLTLAIYSFLYGDNPLYKFAEHIFVGVSAGYGVVITYYEAVLPDLINPMFRPEKAHLEHANYWPIIPGILGLMILARFIPRYDWLARWPIAFIIGLGAGAAIPNSLRADIMVQLSATVSPLWVKEAGKPLALMAWDSLSAFLLIVGVICTLSYFYFSLPHRGALGYSSRLGVWFLMVAFGAGFGNTVMARLSLLIGRVEFLRYDWWPTVGPLFHRLFHLG